MTSRSQRERARADQIDSLRRETFRMSLRPSAVGMNKRVNLLLLERSVTRAALAAHLGFSAAALTRWLDDNQGAERFGTPQAISAMSRFLRAPAPWIATGSLAKGAPTDVEPYLRWIDALTAVAAVQLYCLLKIRRCPVVFFALLEETALVKAHAVTTPLPGPLTPPYRETWNEVMKDIPFLPADAQGDLARYWDLIAEVETNPNLLLDPDTNQTVHMACSWAVSWAQKMVSGASLTRSELSLAHTILRHRLRPRRRHSGSMHHFDALGVEEPSAPTITAAPPATAEPTRAG